MLPIVRVHWNYHKKCWSVIGLPGARTTHMEHLRLINATMHVSKAGRLRARRERVKNVHAHIRGVLFDGCYGTEKMPLLQITYSPFSGNGFVLKDHKPGPPVIAAIEARFLSDGKCLVVLPIYDLTGLKKV